MRTRIDVWRLCLSGFSIVLAATLGLGGVAPLAGAESDEPQFRLLKEHVQEGSRDFAITTLSARNDLVTGGDVLVRVDAAASVALDKVRVDLNGSDVSAAFQPVPGHHAIMGLVTGLVNGDNLLSASEKGKKSPSGRLRVTNYPITGPIFSGPHETPFFCTTTTFNLPTTGGNLGAPLDADCSIATRVDYVYRATNNTFKPLTVNGVLPATMPADVAMTTTNAGATVRFIVRVETGTVNRGIYQIAILHNPYIEPTPSPFFRPAGWNGKLIFQHGAGCQAGWFTQGTATGGVLDANLLGRGYARASNSLNVFNQNCNDLLASETTVMTKERFIERYGVPTFTLGTGSSGGSYQSHQTAENYPGIFDGILVMLAFPDVVTVTAFTVGDARLLHHYFSELAPGVFTQEQQRLVSGFGQFGSIATLSDSGTSARRLDPTGDFKVEVPVDVRYDPITNPGGARGDIYDHTVNVYGRDPDTGFARRPLDNVGVQYGLGSLNAGVITKDQFLDLNARIGGFDIDLNHIPERHVGDKKATIMARESGRVLQGAFGLSETPIVDVRNYNDANVNGDIHQIVNNFTTRERLKRSNGHHDNHIILIGGRFNYTPDSPDLGVAWDQLDRWVTAIQADTSNAPKSVKVVSSKPVDLVDACWTPGSPATGGHVKIEEPQEYQGPGHCNDLYPRFATPRMVAGSPLVQDVMNCHLKPIDPADYAVTFTAEELARLNAIFAKGVCDWTKRTGEYRPTKGTWASFGPAGFGADR